MKLTALKVFSLLLAAILIVNFVGLVFRVITPLVFWVVIVLIAIATYKLIPKLRTK
jgi:uncharacterized membrane-anchored protein